MHKPVNIGEKVFTVMNTLFMILVVFVTIYPLYYVLIVSLSDGLAVQTRKVVLWPVKPTLSTYKLIFQDPMFFRSYINTIIYTVVGTFINIIMTILCAYPLSKKDFYGKDIFTLLIVITMFFSGGLIPSYLLVQKLGMIDTMWALVIPGCINSWNMIIMRTFFQNLPGSLFESASIDGANELQQLILIALPLSIPVLVTLIIFYAVGHWNSFFSAMIYLNDKSKFPVQITLRNIVLTGEMPKKPGEYVGPRIDVISLNIKYAVIIVVAVPIITIYPFFQKYFIKGTMVGALKG